VVLAALLEVHGAPLVVGLEVGVGEADSVAEGGVEVSAVEAAAVVVDSLPVEAEEGLLLGDAAEANLTLSSINELLFVKLCTIQKSRIGISFPYPVVRRSQLETAFQIPRVKLISESIYISPKLPNFRDKFRSSGFTFLDIVYLTARKV